MILIKILEHGVYMYVLYTCAAVLSSLVYHGEQLRSLGSLFNLLVVPISRLVGVAQRVRDS